MINIINNIPALLLATTNKGKQRELRALLADLPCACITPGELGLTLDVPETGSTYAENASIKAAAYLAASGLMVVADDTGLEVEVLGGAPGVWSARFSELANATDADRRAKLLRVLEGKPRPWLARFQCVVAVAVPGKDIRLFQGSVEGEVLGEERGEHGFGYDRLFWIPAAGKMMAELDLAEKNQYSHRAAAIRNAKSFLMENLV